MKPTSIRCRAAFTLAPCAVLLFMAALPGVQLSAQKIVKFDKAGRGHDHRFLQRYFCKRHEHPWGRYGILR